MTELIWDGKYDAAGRRVAPVRVALPFQSVETVNESAQQRQRTLDLFSAGRNPSGRNRLTQEPSPADSSRSLSNSRRLINLSDMRYG